MEIKICYINYWTDPENDRWWTEFIKFNFKNCKIIEVNYDYKNPPDLIIASVFGSVKNILNLIAKCKIFYYGENLVRFPEYNLNLLNCNFDYIVGFDKTDLNNKKIRFPLWFMYYKFYNFDDNENNIIKFLNESREINIKNIKNKFASCIARHDNYGQRTKICNKIQNYGKIYYPSNFRNNENKIGNKIYDKINYLKDCIYNICPENTSAEGYYTEKIFHAFEAGCIPIYWAISNPESEILNEKSYIFINNLDNMDNINEKLNTENIEKYYKTNIFNENSNVIIKNYYNILIDAIKNKLCYYKY